MGMRWAAGSLLVLTTLGLTACGSSSESVPAECVAPPVQVQAESHGAIDAGGADVEIADAVARATTDPPGYTLYLADFAISREVARSADRSRVIDGTPGLLAQVRLEVAPSDPAIAAGDVLRPNDAPHPQKGSWVAWSSVSYRDGDPTAVLRDTSGGQVTIAYLDDETLCADIDLWATYEGDVAVEIRGVVSFEIVVQALR